MIIPQSVSISINPKDPKAAHKVLSTPSKKQKIPPQKNKNPFYLRPQVIQTAINLLCFLGISYKIGSKNSQPSQNVTFSTKGIEETLATNIATKIKANTDKVDHILTTTQKKINKTIDTKLNTFTQKVKTIQQKFQKNIEEQIRNALQQKPVAQNTQIDLSQLDDIHAQNALILKKIDLLLHNQASHQQNEPTKNSSPAMHEHFNSIGKQLDSMKNFRKTLGQQSILLSPTASVDTLATNANDTAGNTNQTPELEHLGSIGAMFEASSTASSFGRKLKAQVFVSPKTQDKDEQTNRKGITRESTDIANLPIIPSDETVS
ncbi:MAG: hypothetical protein AAF380_02175 [Bacteroidota bacterium]